MNETTNPNEWADYMEDMRENYPWSEQQFDQELDLEMRDVRAFEEIVRQTERRGF